MINNFINLEHGKDCEEKGSENFEFDRREISEKTAPSFSDKTENQIPNLTKGGHFEQHTCIKSTISAEHRSLCIDLKSYVLVMLQKLGAKQTLKIISDSQLQKVFFTEEFYYKCILSSLLENHQRLVTVFISFIYFCLELMFEGLCVWVCPFVGLPENY